MTLTGERARLDGRVVATDLDRALEQLAEADRLRADAVVLLAGLQDTGLERFCGYVSWERLVAHRRGWSNRSAAVLVGVARHVDRFGLTAAALEAGVIGVAQAEVLARAARGLEGAYEVDEAELLSVAERVQVDELERVCRQWRNRADTEAAAGNAERRWEQRGLWMQQAFDGSCQGRFQLDPVGAELLARALDTEPDSTSGYAEPRTLAQRRADRLVELCQQALADNEPGETGGLRTTVDVVIDVETLAGADGPLDRLRAELAHGAPIAGPGLDRATPAPPVRRAVCDASFRALVTDGARVVFPPRPTTGPPPTSHPPSGERSSSGTGTAPSTAVTGPGTGAMAPPHRPPQPGRPDHRSEPHPGGRHCRFHHTLIHEGGWQLTRAPDGTIHTSTP